MKSGKDKKTRKLTGDYFIGWFFLKQKKQMGVKKTKLRRKRGESITTILSEYWINFAIWIILILLFSIPFAILGSCFNCDTYCAGSIFAIAGEIDSPSPMFYNPLSKLIYTALVLIFLPIVFVNLGKRAFSLAEIKIPPVFSLMPFYTIGLIIFSVFCIFKSALLCDCGGSVKITQDITGLIVWFFCGLTMVAFSYLFMKTEPEK